MDLDSDMSDWNACWNEKCSNEISRSNVVQIIMWTAYGTGASKSGCCSSTQLRAPFTRSNQVWGSVIIINKVFRGIAKRIVCIRLEDWIFARVSLSISLNSLNQCSVSIIESTLSVAQERMMTQMTFSPHKKVSISCIKFVASNATPWLEEGRMRRKSCAKVTSS